MSKIVELIGAPLDLGASMRGCAMGPCALRVAGVADRLTALGHRVIDNGDLSASPVHDINIAGRAKNAAEITFGSSILFLVYLRCSIYSIFSVFVQQYFILTGS